MHPWTRMIQHFYPSCWGGCEESKCPNLRQDGWGPLTSTRQMAAVSSADDKQGSWNSPDSKANMPRTTALHGNLGLNGNRQKPGEMTWEIQCDHLQERCLPRNLQKCHWNQSLNLLPQKNAYYACHSGRMFTRCCHMNNWKNCDFPCWVIGKFLLLVPVAGKNGYFLPSSSHMT